MNEVNKRLDFNDKIVELSDSNKDMILDFISEKVLNYYGEEWAVGTEEKKQASKLVLTQNYDRELSEKKLRIFSCIAENIVLGTIAVKNELYVQLFFVEETVQNKGIEVSLLNHIQKIYDNLSVLATKENEHFYKENGFFRTQDVVKDTIYMKYFSPEKMQGYHATKK